MKRLLFVIALLFVAPCMAQTMNVELAWDASPTPNVQYAVYPMDYENGYGFGLDAAIWTGPELNCTVTVPDDRQTAFVVRAWRPGVIDIYGNPGEPTFSGNSNQVIATPEPPVIEPPQQMLIVRIIMAVLDFFGPSDGLS